MLERLGLSFLFLGLALVFLGFILLIVAKNKTKVEAGGAIFIGPFPLFLGATSENMLLLVITFALLTILLALLLSVIRW